MDLLKNQENDEKKEFVIHNSPVGAKTPNSKGPNLINLEDSGHNCLLYTASTILPVENQEVGEVEEKESDANVTATSKIVSSKECQLLRPRLTNVGTCKPLPSTADLSIFVTPHLLYDDMEGISKPRPVGRGRRRPITWWRSHSCVVMERILCSLNTPPLHQQVQCFKSDPLDLTLAYNYDPQIVNSFYTEALKGYKISGIDQSQALPHVFAVGLYEVRRGAVCLWTLKNVVSPERLYRFPSSVTCLKFSKQSPNMLAVGFNDGQVVVMDVNSTRKKILLQVPYVGSQIVTCVQWWQIGDTEWLTFTNGNFVYKLRRPFVSAETKPFIQATYMTSKEDVGIRRLTASFSLTIGPTVRGLWHPTCEPEIYLLGDAEGEIRLCSIHSSYEFFDTYPAHEGVVNAIKPSPVCDQLYITCGSDGTARIWCLHVQEPLLTLETSIISADVRDVTWSPSHGTVVVGITAQDLCVWDFHRKFHEPVSVTALPVSPRCVEFSLDGSFLLVGTVDGSVLIVGLKDMPFAENFKHVSAIYALRWWIEVSARNELLDEFISTIKMPKLST